MTDRQTADRCRGFTLIELLAVVAIILLLVSLLAPTLGLARQRAEFARCKANLGQIGQATVLYCTDSKDGDYPYCWDWVYSEGGKSGELWVEWSKSNSVERGTIKPFMGNSRTSTFLCPTFARIYVQNPAVAHLTPYVSYDMNEYYRGTNGGNWKGYSIHRSMMYEPAKEGMFCEEDPWINEKYGHSMMNNMCFGPPAYGTNGVLSTERVDALGSFHLPPNGDLNEGYGNVWFADGHVARAHPSETREIMTPVFVKKSSGF